MKLIEKKKEQKTVVQKAEAKGERMIFVRLPPALRARFARQEKRFSCSANMLARMGIIRFLEEAEAQEQANEVISGGRK